MIRIFFICCALSLLPLSIVFGQSEPVKETPVVDAKKGNEKNVANTKDIKTVPATTPKGAKPAKISSAARPGTIRPNQPVNTRKVPVKGKPSKAGKPSGN